MANFLINDIPATIKSATVDITAKASISPNKMQIVVDGTQLEDFSKGITNEEIRTQENRDFFKSLVIEVLEQQGLI
jgi:hypothetical protein